MNVTHHSDAPAAPICPRKMGTLITSSVRAAGLPLCPRQPTGFPAGELPSMSLRIQWPFKSISNIAAVRKACRHHGPSSHEAAPSGPADEQQLAVGIRSCSIQRLFQTIDEACVDPVIGKRLPLDEDRPLTNRCEIWKAYKRPLRLRSHIDQNRMRVRLQSRPCFIHRHIINVDSVQCRHATCSSTCVRVQTAAPQSLTAGYPEPWLVDDPIVLPPTHLTAVS